MKKSKIWLALLAISLLLCACGQENECANKNDAEGELQNGADKEAEGHRFSPY